MYIIHIMHIMHKYIVYIVYNIIYFLIFKLLNCTIRNRDHFKKKKTKSISFN